MWVYYICFLLCWGYFYACFWRVFIITGCWILSKAFSASTEIIIWFLSFKLLMWCITLIDLWILKNPCIPEIKPTWSWCMTFLICCWILFARILLGIFATMSISDIGLQFSFFFFPFFFFFLVACLSGFGISVMAASQNKMGVYLTLQFSRRVWADRC